MTRLSCAFLPAFLLVHTGNVFAQWPADSVIDGKIQRGIEHIYNIQFVEADKNFDEVIKLRSEHPVGYFFKAMTQWWRVLTCPDESEDENFYVMLERVIDLCDGVLEKNPDDVTALFFKGGSLGFRGRLRANRSNWFGAAQDGLKALPIVQKAHLLDPQNEDVLLGIGIYNYYADVVPTEYPVVKPFMIFFPGGDKKKGFEQLVQASERAKYARTEATYFLMQNYFLYEKEYLKALALAELLNARYPRNPVFHRYRGRCNVSIGNWAEAFRIFSEVVKRFREKETGYDSFEGREAYYYLGLYYFTFGNYAEALKNLLICDELSRGIDKDSASGFMSMANLRIGMIFDVQNRRREALSQYTKVLKMKEFESTHRDAQRFIDQPFGKQP